MAFDQNTVYPTDMRYTEIMVKLFCLFVFCGRISFVVEVSGQLAPWTISPRRLAPSLWTISPQHLDD